MTWTTLTLEVTTPLFNGGADPDGSAGFRPDDEAGVRVASIRGAMRFWFRALAGTVAGPDLRLLAGLERHVFGDAGNPSPLQMRIPQQPRIERTEAPEFLAGERGKWIGYLLGPGMIKYDAANHRFRLTRQYISVGQKFDIKLRFPRDDVGTLALGALRLCCMYGGFGARTRRGFGGVRIIEVDGPLAGPWTEDSLKGRGLADFAGVRSLQPTGELATCREVLAGVRKQVLPDLGSPVSPQQEFDSDWSGPPPYPVLSKAWSVVGVSGGESFENWQKTLRHAGKQLRHFRAPEDNDRPDAKYQPKIETPEWKDVVYGTSDHFKVGALGLPVVYKDGYVVNVDRRSGRDAEKLRRASPLWLRAVETGGNWRLLSFAFLGQFLPGPDAPQVHLWERAGQSKALQITDDDVRQLAGQWISELRADRSFIDTARRA
jgi:CRISPR type III-B/RAMP module RAMP protein Cmr1